MVSADSAEFNKDNGFFITSSFFFLLSCWLCLRYTLFQLAILGNPLIIDRLVVDGDCDSSGLAILKNQFLTFFYVFRVAVVYGALQ